jgi:hypothetical protein
MIPIAGVLLLIIVVFTVAVVVSNPGVSDLSIFGASIPTTSAGIYFTGAGAMLVLILAAALMRRGIKRELARRRQLNELKQAAGDQAGSAGGSPGVGRSVSSSPAGGSTSGVPAEGEAPEAEVPGSKVSGGGARAGGAEQGQASAAQATDDAEAGRETGGSGTSTGTLNRSGSGAHAVTAKLVPDSLSDRDEHVLSAAPHVQQRRSDEPAPNPLAAGFGPPGAQSPTASGPAGRDVATSAAERQALLDEAEELAGDGPDR